MTAIPSYEEVLVPTDGSEAVTTSTAHALSVGDDSTRVHALYVVDQRVTMSAPANTREELQATLQEEGQAAVSSVADQVEGAGRQSSTAIREGTPSKEILEYAQQEGIDLIVIGSSGKSPREKVMTMGSVSERVVDNATLPVLVVKDD